MRRGEATKIDGQMEAFGASMREARRGAGLSQEDLSEAALVDRAAISFLEHAKRAPDLRTLLKIARALQRTPADLVRGTGPRRHNPQAPHRGEDPEDPARRLGANLRDARITAKLSQEELSLMAGVDRAAISVYEHGRREPNLRTILKLASALEVPASTLLEGVE